MAEHHFPVAELDPNFAGKLQQISDIHGNKVTLTYETNQGLLDTVTDTAGTPWKFNYNVQSRLSTVTSLGWTITFTCDDVAGAGHHGRGQMFDSREMFDQSGRDQFPGLFPEDSATLGFQRNGNLQNEIKAPRESWI